VATRPHRRLEAYKAKLNQSVFKSALIMRPVFEAAGTASRRIVFAEGEDERVLRAAQAMLEETTETPILIGRPEVIERRAERAGLTIRPSVDFELVNPENDPRYRDYWGTYHSVMQRRGVTPDLARAIMRTNTTAIGAVMVHRDEADSPDLRHVRAVSLALELRPPTPWNAKAASNRRAEPDDPGGRPALHRRHPCPCPAQRPNRLPRRSSPRRGT
jgi:hypothetical protein